MDKQGQQRQNREQVLGHQAEDAAGAGATTRRRWARRHWRTCSTKAESEGAPRNRQRGWKAPAGSAAVRAKSRS